MLIGTHSHKAPVEISLGRFGIYRVEVSNGRR
jgi:hypothetical protein